MAAAERLFGYTAQEMIGQPVFCSFLRTGKTKNHAFLNGSHEANRSTHYETIRRSKDGTEFTCLADRIALFIPMEGSLEPQKSHGISRSRNVSKLHYAAANETCLIFSTTPVLACTGLGLTA